MVSHRVKQREGKGKQTFSERQRRRRMYLIGEQIAKPIDVGTDFRRPFMGAENAGALEAAADGAPARDVEAKEKAAASRGSGIMERTGPWKNFVRRSKKVMKKLSCGAVAGAISRTMTAPVETVKTVMMVSGDGQGAVAVGIGIVKRDGWRGLFRGNWVNVIRVAPGKAIELFAFDTMRKLLVDEKGDSKLPVPLPPASVAGACAGLSSTCVCYPMEVVKTRLTVEAGKYSGIGDCFMSIARDEGVTALYRGLLASALGIIPYAATNYYTYDGLRKVYRKFKRKRMMKSGDTSSNINYIGPLPTLVIGSTSGAIAATATFPLEVVRRQLQAGSLNGQMYTSMTDCARGIWRTHGIRGFYRGLGPSCFKLMPAAGISFATYELMKSLLLTEQTAGTQVGSKTKEGKERRASGSEKKDTERAQKKTTERRSDSSQKRKEGSKVADKALKPQPS